METKFLVSLFLVTLSTFASSEINFKKRAPQVKLANNALVSGKVDFSREGRPFHSFTGIPFGKVTERFQEAKPAILPAENVFNADKPGPLCSQPDFKPEIGTIGEEDCLNLNVYVPMNNTQRKGGYAVMVWVHGGGFIAGSGSIYGPKYFMDEDVILVTFNYRLGVFGFLSTDDPIIPGNAGLKDQVLALKWVQQHIKNFGGDPEKVTVFGESAGGASVHYLLLSPLTKGLFRNAISQSGSALAPWAYNPYPFTTAMRLSNFLKCPTTATDPFGISSEEIATCLKSVSVEELNKAQYAFSPKWPIVAFPLSFIPCKEPSSSSAFMDVSPWSMILEKTSPFKEVPWMTGVTEDEGAALYSGVIYTDKKLVEELDTQWDTIILRTNELDKFVHPDNHLLVANKIRKFYFENKAVSEETRVNLTNMYSDVFFTTSVRKGALETALSGKKNSVYLYEYAHQGPKAFMEIFGFSVAEVESKKIGHADDLLMLFDVDKFFPAAAGLVEADSEHEAFSKNLVKLWVSFAIHGKPKYTWGTSKDVWRPISMEEKNGNIPLKWYKIDANPSYKDEQMKERAVFWDNLVMNNFNLNSVLSPEAASALKKTQKTEL